MQIMFRAIFESSGQDRAVTHLQLRMYTQTLIGRSLVIGTVERPQLHDIVRDYTLASFLPADLRLAQQKVVDAFCVSRPSKMYGWNALDRSTVAEYVVQEIGHHVRSSIELGGWTANPSFPAWVDSLPSDTIAYAAWECLDLQDLCQLVEQASVAGDNLKTAVRLHAQAVRLKRMGLTDERELFSSLCPRIAAAVDALFDPAPPENERRAREGLAMRLLGNIFGTRDIEKIQTYCLPRMRKLAHSDAIFEDALDGPSTLQPFFKYSICVLCSCSCSCPCSCSRSLCVYRAINCDSLRCRTCRCIYLFA
eukprot:SAG31_NODE_5403_length_2556_cov_8.128060_1_plen_308_part_00